jgi:hypothetical protein
MGRCKCDGKPTRCILGSFVEIGPVCLSNIAVLKIAVSVSSSFLFVSCSVLVGVFNRAALLIFSLFEVRWYCKYELECNTMCNFECIVYLLVFLSSVDVGVGVGFSPWNVWLRVESEE